MAAIARDQRDEPAQDLFQLVLDDPDAEPRVRTHAGWILAHLRHADGDLAGAVAGLTAALEASDPADAEVRQRITALLDRWAIDGG